MSDMQPTGDAERVIQSAPPLMAMAFRALVAEPNTGIGIVTGEGVPVYLNDQAARIFHGPDARAEQYIGRPWSEYMPPDWVEQRLKVFRQMIVHGKPVLMRSIWRDFQHFTWVSHIQFEPDPADRFTSEPAPDLFLTITRRVGTDEEAERLAPKSEYEEVESEVVRLKKLDVLSDRELEVLALLGQGLSLKEAARVLFRSEKTIERHRDSIHSKLHVGDRAELVKIATRAGLTLSDAERPRV